MEPLKNIYSPAFFEKFCAEWKTLNPRLEKSNFLDSVFDDEWKNLELKDRFKHIAQCMHTQLSNNFEEACILLVSILKKLEEKGEPVDNYAYLFIPNYIEIYGQEQIKSSLKYIHQVTQFVSCEFTIRPLIKQEPEEVMKQMLIWSKDPHPNVRRLASEGCRPRLPWSMALPDFKKNPTPILPILENLKADTALFVRKSVANNLNDISKDHPKQFIRIVRSWKGKNAHTDWIIKHSSRSLLKAGEPEIMTLFDYGDLSHFKFSKLNLLKTNIQLGQALGFTFNIQNTSKTAQLLRVEYGLYFLKANGSQNRKVFKLSERVIKAGEEVLFQKKHIIKPISTRRYYFGEQKICLILNGIEQKPINFQLLS